MSDASDSNATQHVTRESDEIEGLADTVQSFLAAFAALDWEPFRRSFADDATVFFPLADHPQRAEGREEIERLFRGVFERARADSPNGPPYLALQPHDLSIRRMGDWAIWAIWARAHALPFTSTIPASSVAVP